MTSIISLIWLKFFIYIYNHFIRFSTLFKLYLVLYSLKPRVVLGMGSDIDEINHDKIMESHNQINCIDEEMKFTKMYSWEVISLELTNTFLWKKKGMYQHEGFEFWNGLSYFFDEF